MQMEDGAINPNSMWSQAHLVGLLHWKVLIMLEITCMSEIRQCLLIHTLSTRESRMHLLNLMMHSKYTME